MEWSSIRIMDLKDKNKKFILRAKSIEDKEFRDEFQLRLLKILNFDTFSLNKVLSKIFLEVRTFVKLGYQEHDSFYLSDKGQFSAMYFKMNGGKVVSSIYYNINIKEYAGV